MRISCLKKHFPNPYFESLKSLLWLLPLTMATTSSRSLDLLWTFSLACRCSPHHLSRSVLPRFSHLFLLGWWGFFWAIRRNEQVHPIYWSIYSRLWWLFAVIFVVAFSWCTVLCQRSISNSPWMAYRESSPTIITIIGATNFAVALASAICT